MSTLEAKFVFDVMVEIKQRTPGIGPTKGMERSYTDLKAAVCHMERKAAEEPGVVRTLAIIRTQELTLEQAIMLREQMG